jgi:hypothetical protein
VGPRAVLDAVVKRKIPSPRRESNPRTPIVQTVTVSSRPQRTAIANLYFADHRNVLNISVLALKTPKNQPVFKKHNITTSVVILSQLTNYIVQGILSKVDSLSADEEIPLYTTRSFITVFKTARHWSLS